MSVVVCFCVIVIFCSVFFYVATDTCASWARSPRVPPSQLYDHNFIGRDEPMGSIEIDIRTLSRDASTVWTGALDGVRAGEIELELRRAVISSRPLRSLLFLILSKPFYLSTRLSDCNDKKEKQ